MKMESKRIVVEDEVGNKYDLIEIDRITFPAYFTKDPADRLRQVREMPGRDDDVIIAAYPKAGTHWVWEITNMLLQGSTEYHSSMKEAQMLEITDQTNSTDLPSPRVFNSHLRFRQLPKDMISRNCKIIYVIRNPKDMAVSRYAHAARGALGYKGTFANYLPLYIDGKIAFGSWFDYTTEWEKDMAENQGYPVHTICFEELKKDSENSVKKMAKFLKARSEGAFISEVCKKCSFTELKSAYEGSKKLFDDKDKNPLDYAFRKGQIGDWKNWFTVAMSEQFDAQIESKIPGHKTLYIYE